MSKMEKYTKEELIELAKKSTSFGSILKAMGYAHGGANITKLKRIYEENGINAKSLFKKIKHYNAVGDNDVFKENSEYSRSALRDRFKKINIAEYKCSICGIGPYWQKNELKLRIDHINGNNTDNRVENLRWVCPNCDSQLPTYCRRKDAKEKTCILCGERTTGKSKYCDNCRTKVKREVLFFSKKAPGKEQLEKDLLELRNLELIGRKYDVSGKAVKKWCKKYRIIKEGEKIKDYLYRTKQNRDQIELIKKLFQEKKSFNSIAKRMNKTPTYVKNILLKEGIIQKEENFKTPKKRVAQINAEGEVIKIYESIRAANQSMTGKAATGGVSKVIRGKAEKAYGYYWEKAEE